jgi:hypothetical protein
MFEFQQILDYGTFYFPSWKHYNRQLNVVCDRCRTQNLPACIGHGQQDLCLVCANELTRNVTHSTFPIVQHAPPAIIYNPNPFANPNPPFANPFVNPNPNLNPFANPNPNDYFSDYKKC